MWEGVFFAMCFEVRTMYYPRFIEELFKPQDADMNDVRLGCWFVFVYWNENIWKHSQGLLVNNAISYNAWGVGLLP